MGASGSIQNALCGLGEEMSDKLQQLEAAKGELAKADELIYKVESSKLFKDHLVLIELFTRKSRSQLAKFVTDTSIRTTDVEKLLGSDYGKFIAALTVPEWQIDLQMAKLALSGVGADEELLVSIFCCRTAAEIQVVAAAFERETNTKLLDKVKARTFKDPKYYNNILSVFFSKILAGDRYEGTDVDIEAATGHAAQIKAMKNNEFVAILDIVCCNSRQHCAAINDACIAQYKTSLEEIIKEKIGKVISYEALRLWCMPIAESYATMLDKFSSRTDIVFNSIARLAKRDLNAINEACKQSHKKPLKDVIDAGISGNLKRAVVSWIEQPPFDGGCEDELNSWLIEQSAAGHTLDQLMSNSEMYDYVAGNIQAQIDSYKAAGFGRNATLKRVQSEKNIKKSASTLSVAPESTPELAIAEYGASASTIQSDIGDNSESNGDKASASLAVGEGGGVAVGVVGGGVEEQSYQVKCEKVKEYISYVFTLCDTDSSNEMSTDEFNQFVRMLKLTEFGYTQDELDIMMIFCDADGSGEVCFSEVIDEMTDTVINGIENLGGDVCRTIEQYIEALRSENSTSKSTKSKKSKKSKKGNAKGTPAAATDGLSLPTDLETFLIDSFQGFDLDSNGILDRNEFWQLMNSLNLGLSNEDIENLQTKWDENQDGGINWKEALPLFVHLMHGMASDQRDHFIGLLDKTSGYLFWYNLRDKSTQWMSEEDQAIYAPGARSLDNNGGV